MHKKKKQASKEELRNAKKTGSPTADEGCQCCTEDAATKKPRTFFVQKL